MQTWVTSAYGIINSKLKSNLSGFHQLKICTAVVPKPDQDYGRYNLHTWGQSLTTESKPVVIILVSLCQKIDLNCRFPTSLNSCKLQVIYSHSELLWGPPVHLINLPGIQEICMKLKCKLELIQKTFSLWRNPMVTWLFTQSSYFPCYMVHIQHSFYHASTFCWLCILNPKATANGKILCWPNIKSEHTCLKLNISASPVDIHATGRQNRKEWP